jgi:hypothetical protein
MRLSDRLHILIFLTFCCLLSMCKKPTMESANIMSAGENKASQRSLSSETDNPILTKFRQLKVATGAHLSDNPDVLLSLITKEANSDELLATFPDDKCRKLKISASRWQADPLGIIFFLDSNYCSGEQCDKCQARTYSCLIAADRIQVAKKTFIGDGATGIPCARR